MAGTWCSALAAAMARSVPAAVPGLCDMVPRGVVPRRGTAHAWRCQATLWDVTPRHVTCCVPRCAMCYTVPCHVPRRDVPRPVPCRVPRRDGPRLAPCRVPRPLVCHVPLCCATSRAVPHPTPCHARPGPIPPHAAIPRVPARTTGTAWPPEYSPSLPTDTRTHGHNRSVAHGPRSTLYFLLPLYKNTGVPRARGGRRPSHSTKKYCYS